MNEHPIEGLMVTAMNSIKDMIDVNTIVGEPINTENVVIIPISKVTFGFAAGGSEFKGETIDEYTKKEKEEEIQYRLPFGGGSGAGVNINPIAFLVVQDNHVKLLPVNHSSCIDKLLDYMPEVMEKANQMLCQCIQKKKGENQDNSENKNEDKTNKKEKDKKEQEHKKPEEIDVTIKTKQPKKKEMPNIITTYEFDTSKQDDADKDIPVIEYENFDEEEIDEDE